MSLLLTVSIRVCVKKYLGKQNKCRQTVLEYRALENALVIIRGQIKCGPRWSPLGNYSPSFPNEPDSPSGSKGLEHADIEVKLSQGRAFIQTAQIIFYLRVMPAIGTIIHNMRNRWK